MPTVDSHNPDVLTCLANLSSDEVFTPPDLANQVLDLLPAELWRDPNARFLDPACKSGVFLREIARRLQEGLAEQIPDRQERVNHILKNQVFGIAITELTALLSRRSVYCSKTANGKYSVCTAFDTEDGNIRFERVEHTWQNRKCKYCGASKLLLDRGEGLETHAYAFIHAENLEDYFDMRFDVIVSNPPYHMTDSGFGDSARPIFHHFILQARKLMPRFLCMIVPARWYSGGKGLDGFRDDILKDSRMREIHDFPETSDCFPGLNIRGGVCYFLWDKSYRGESGCKVINYQGGQALSTDLRPLLEPGSEFFVRYNRAVSILRKVRLLNEDTMVDQVSSRKPFGIPTNYSDFSEKRTDTKSILLYRFGPPGYIELGDVASNVGWIDRYKVIVAKASPGGDDYPHSVFSKPIISEPQSVCSETYIVVRLARSADEAKNIVSYINTRFFRFLVLLVKQTQDVPRKVYSFVPVQDFSKPWTDEELYEKYGLTPDEIAFIESMVRPMEPSGE